MLEMKPVYGSVRVSNVNLALTRSETNGTKDPNYTNASSPTSESSFTCQDNAKIRCPETR